MRLQLKSLSQGAATIVWAAVAKEWATRGGKYLEDCSESQPANPESRALKGYVPYAYDHAAAQKLWDLALKWTNVADD
jgi:hypothetical protein